MQGELRGRLIAQGRVWPRSVVVDPPSCDQLARMSPVAEQGLVQELVAHPSIEAFDKTILHWLARRDVMPVDPVLGAPPQDCIGGQLRAVNDTFWVDAAGDRIIETAAGGTDLVNASIGINLDNASGAYANVENVTLTGTAVLNAYGSAANNILTGNSAANVMNGRGGNDRLVGGAEKDSLHGEAGNDTLDGGTGADRMVGGLGDDIYVVDNASDIIVETATGGTDRINATVNIDLNRSGDVYANVESIILLGTEN